MEGFLFRTYEQLHAGASTWDIISSWHCIFLLVYQFISLSVCLLHCITKTGNVHQLHSQFLNSWEIDYLTAFGEIPFVGIVPFYLQIVNCFLSWSHAKFHQCTYTEYSQTCFAYLKTVMWGLLKGHEICVHAKTDNFITSRCRLYITGIYVCVYFFITKRLREV